MDERYLAAIDLGSSKITLSVAMVTGDNIQILFHKSVPSKGIRNSKVFNPTMASVPIREIIAEAEKELKIKIMKLIVSLPKSDILQASANGSIERSDPDSSISTDEIEILKSIAQDSCPLPDPGRMEIFGCSAQGFNSDYDFGLKENDIIGVLSEKLEGNFKFFIGKKSLIKAIDHIFTEQMKIDFVTYFTPLTTSKAVLTEEQKDNGVALIELGAATTSVAVFKGNVLRHFASIPFGCQDITSDIKAECVISEHLAENIKLAYGGCMPEKLQTLKEKVLRIDDYMCRKDIPVAYLSEIISARVKELVDAMLYEIQASGLADDLRSGVVITGGGANIANIAGYIKSLSGYTVTIGYPRSLFSAKGCDEVYSLQSTACLGLILAGKQDGIENCVVADGAEYVVRESNTATVVGPAVESKDNEVPEPAETTSDIKEDNVAAASPKDGDAHIIADNGRSDINRQEGTPVIKDKPVEKAKPAETEIRLAEKLNLNINQSGRIKYVIHPAKAAENAAIEWSSSNPDIVAIDSAGIVTAKSKGSAFITARVGNASARCKVSVVKVSWNFKWVSKLYDDMTK